jgi:hypothetical protein
LISSFLVGLLAGCTKELKIDYKDLRNAEFTGLTFQLPGIFVETDLDGLAEAWSLSKASKNVIDKQLQRIESLRPREGTFAVYVDTTEISNTVFIFTGPYIKISKWTSEQLFKMLDKTLRKEANDIGMDFKPVENSYYTLKNGNDILKVKFEGSNESMKKLVTQYLLNIRGSTFGIIVTDDEDDFEAIVRKAKFTSF